jgi:hypothetical protein
MGLRYSAHRDCIYFAPLQYIAWHIGRGIDGIVIPCVPSITSSAPVISW